jgi:hypothetical protein
MLMCGKYVNPGVTGGAALISNGVYGASDIDSATGAAATGGDVARADSHIAAAKTLGVALGIDIADLHKDFTDGGTVKHIATSIVA